MPADDSGTTDPAEASGPLEGITVLDAASLYAGPLAATYLADFGADVFKIEHPDGGDPVRQFGGDDLSWKWVGRNKQSVPLDLSALAGRDAFLDLVADADVLIESFRPGTLEDWGLGWETLSAHNPSLVMVRTTGFGQDGPYSDRPGFGTLIESMSGFAYSTGMDDGPPTLPPVALADSICALHSTFATVAALYWRDAADGTGQYIDVSILESMFAVMGDVVTRYHADGECFRRNGNTSRMTVPRNTYKTADDRWVAISGSTENIARRILEIVGGEELATDERFATMDARIDHSEELDAIIADWIAERSREDVIDIFEANEAALGPVYNMEDIFADEHFAARDAVLFVEDYSGGGPGEDSDEGEDARDVAMRGIVPKFSETPGSVDHVGPALGEHAREVLESHADLTDEEIDELLAAGLTTDSESATE
jgi:crotonobetainyl-CoA:carnitine CoA-transferase CaiB-like acyl-CoA transferase